MTDDEPTPATFDEKADRILENLGLDPEGPSTQFTYGVGFQLGYQLAGLLPDERDAFDDMAREILAEFVSIFPTDPDLETQEIQTYFLAPLVSVFLTGRGLTVPQLAELAGVSPEHAYRLNRKGLSIVFNQTEAPVRGGVNRRFSGVDGRQTLLTLDLQGFPTKTWPEPLSDFQPFLLGLLTGLRSWLEIPANRDRIEPMIRSALTKMLADPGLGELFDGLVVALHRVTQGLRDLVLVMKAEKERAQDFEKVLIELTARRAEILATFAAAGQRAAE